jgi:acyl-CoA synthetase (AMP-forming)/AMP-acid ligase II
VSAAELDAHVLEPIARFKRPKRYEFIDELPKNSYGQGAQEGVAGTPGLTSAT